MTDKFKNILKSDLVWRSSYLKLEDECTQYISKKLLKKTLINLFSWIDTALDAPVYSSLQNGKKRVFIMGGIEYEIDYRKRRFLTTLLYEGASQGEYSHPVTSIFKYFTTTNWLIVALPDLPNKIATKLRNNSYLAGMIFDEVAMTSYQDKRFIKLKEHWLPQHLTPVSEVVTILQELELTRLVDSIDVNLIWGNLEYYQQLIQENCPFLKTYHHVSVQHYIDTLKLKGHVKGMFGVPLSKTDAFFDLKCLKQKIKNEVNLKAWRYLVSHGDVIFRYIWIRLDTKANYAYTTFEYLKFLDKCAYPRPPHLYYLKALFDMQGESWEIRDYSRIWRAVWCDALVAAFHRFDNERAFSKQLGEFLKVMHWALDQQIDPDKNQLKQGWNFFVKKAEEWYLLRQISFEHEGKQWKKSMEDTVINGVKFIEICSVVELFEAGQNLRNCLSTDQSFYDPECYKFFKLIRLPTLERYSSKEIKGLVMFEWSNDNWVFCEALGFANRELMPNEIEAVEQMEIKVHRECLTNQIDYIQIKKVADNINKSPEIETGSAGYETEFYYG